MNWISIKEELPKEDESVLVWAKGDWHVAVYEWCHYTGQMKFEMPLATYSFEASHKDATHWARVEELK